jgi:hypothetical protein
MRDPAALLLCCYLLLCGCRAAEPPETVLPPEYVQVIDLEGRQAWVPSGQWIDARTDQPAVRSVMALDRQSGKTDWIPVEVLLDDHPAAPRYLPVTQTEDELSQIGSDLFSP